MSDLGENDVEAPAIGRTAAGRITWDINVSTVIMVLLALASGMYFVAQDHADNQQAHTEIAEMRGSIQRGFDDVKHDISQLPAQTAALDDLKRRMDGVDRWHDAVETREQRIQDELSGVRADVNSLSRGSNETLLPAGPPLRRRQ
jgi:septal ring factor EnvC (AmiA/AmiB activator)